jgi:TonB family protein
MVILGGTLSWPQSQEPRERAVAKASSEGALRNEDVVKLVKTGMDDAIIIAKIGKSRCQFDTSTDALLQLKQSGVSGAVLEAMAGASPGTGSSRGTNTEIEPQTADEAYRRGTRLMQTRNLDDAVSMFSRAILLKPGWAQAFGARGWAMSQAKRYSEAINDLDEAIRLEPEHAAWYDSRGLAYSNSGQNSRAIEDYTRAIEMSPAISAYYNNRGWAYSELGQFEEAIVDLSRAIQLFPAYAKAYENRGATYGRMKDWPHAIADYTAAIQVTPTAWLYQRRADAEFAAGDQSGAEEDRKKAAAQTATAAAPPPPSAYQIGNGVTAPRVSSKVEAKYSEEARRAKYGGTVVLSVVVDTDGKPRDVRIIRPIGLGLDQNALEAVSQWRFFPGTKDGQAVPVEAKIAVTFSLLDPGITPTTQRSSPHISPSPPAYTPSDPNVSVPPNTTVLDNFAGSSTGRAFGVKYVHLPGARMSGRGASFSQNLDSRIEYPQGIPSEGTLEWWINVASGYAYVDFRLQAHQDQALIFSTDAHGGDVTWPGTAKLFVSANGAVSFFVATNKYNRPPAQPLESAETPFRFNSWHAIGVSYGSQGEAVMVDGTVVASAPARTQTLGGCGKSPGAAGYPHDWTNRFTLLA